MSVCRTSMPLHAGAVRRRGLRAGTGESSAVSKPPRCRRSMAPASCSAAMLIRLGNARLSALPRGSRRTAITRSGHFLQNTSASSATTFSLNLVDAPGTQDVKAFPIAIPSGACTFLHRAELRAVPGINSHEKRRQGGQIGDQGEGDGHGGHPAHAAVEVERR